MANDRRINNEELLSDDELENVTGGHNLPNIFGTSFYVPPQIQELVRQAQENSSVYEFNGKPQM